ncbi:MAG TPA: carboxypeptidase-like regulatory domain-containing protein [Thermoanaerobaculia bacterium]|nr:carboxypeptidase-like regulatory domain-containing protein [Thermoanaerobaculia bacterium]
MLRRWTSIAALALIAAVPAAADDSESAGVLRGKVTVDAAPLGRATVYAYELARLSMIKVSTDADGRFHFADLPAGVYKLIAYKPGFAPAVAALSRAADDARQFVELRLQPETVGGTRQGESYWSVRDAVPPDVLHDIHNAELLELGATPAAQARAFTGAVQAATGVDQGGSGQAHIASAGVGMEGRIGPVALDINGEFWQLSGHADPLLAVTRESEAAALAVRMLGVGEGHLQVTTVSRRAGSVDAAFSAGESDFERYRLEWSQPMGERSHSRFLAQYTEQNNFYREGPRVPREVPLTSRAFNLEGTYQVELSDHAALETGIRYRERAGAFPAYGEPVPERALELFAKGGHRVQPSVLVEYGVFTQMQDGSLALAPQGTVVVQLDSRWQAVGTVSRRLAGDPKETLGAFAPVLFNQAAGGCQELDQHCYRLVFARQGDDPGELVSVTAIHRQVADTLQLYFNDDIFSRMESLYLVQGDEIPELQLVLSRRLTPRVLARLESNFGEGGGGVLYATDASAYQNRVRYLVTSLDTRFQVTSTGVFLAFHHLSQDLDPLAPAVDDEASAMELERLQLMLSQDLNVLARLAADWAVHVNLELSRGDLPFSLGDAEADEIRRRVTGGLSVKF